MGRDGELTVRITPVSASDARYDEGVDLVARGSGELAATWFSTADRMSVRVAVIEFGAVGSDTQPHIVLSDQLRFESWAEYEGEWRRDTAGEYVPVIHLRDGDLGLVTPLQDARVDRFGFTWWRIEMR